MFENLLGFLQRRRSERDEGAGRGRRGEREHGLEGRREERRKGREGGRTEGRGLFSRRCCASLLLHK